MILHTDSAHNQFIISFEYSFWPICIDCDYLNTHCERIAGCFAVLVPMLIVYRDGESEQNYKLFLLSNVLNPDFFSAGFFNKVKLRS